MKGELNLVSQYEVHEYYRTYNSQPLREIVNDDDADSTPNPSASKKVSVPRNIYAEEVHLGLKAYEKSLGNHKRVQSEPYSLAALAFSQKYNLRESFHLFRKHHCDPSFYNNI